MVIKQSMIIVLFNVVLIVKFYFIIFNTSIIYIYILLNLN